MTKPLPKPAETVPAWTAETIKTLRAKGSMTQGQLADFLGVTPDYVGHLEQGRKPAGPQTARLLAVLAERLQSKKKHWGFSGPASRRKAGVQS